MVQINDWKPQTSTMGVLCITNCYNKKYSVRVWYVIKDENMNFFFQIFILTYPGWQLNYLDSTSILICVCTL